MIRKGFIIMPWASLASAGVGFAGDLTSTLLGYYSQKSANAENRRAARRQMAFQLYMANTAHQREVKDLRKAGLNPVLSATGGSGAAVPSGAMAEMEPEFKGLDLSNTISALNAAADLKAKDSQIDTNKALTDLYQSQKTGHDLQNVSSALDNAIKFGYYDDLTDLYPDSGITTDDKGNITISKPARRNGSAYVRHKLGEYSRTLLDNRHKSTALDILNLEKDSTPSLLWNKEWLPRMNSAMNAVSEIGDIVYQWKLIKSLLNKSLNGRRPRRKKGY